MQKRWAAVFPSSLRSWVFTKQPSQYVVSISSISLIIETFFTLSPLRKSSFPHSTTHLSFIPTIVILTEDIFYGTKRFANSRFTKTKEEVFLFNEFWGLGFALFNFVLLLIMYKFFGKTGLFAWVAISTVLANIQVTKTIEIIGLTATLGNSLYASTFLATDILNEKYGRKEAKKAVWLGFSSLLIMVLVMQFGIKFIPAESDFAQGSLETVFGLIPQIAIGSM